MVGPEFLSSFQVKVRFLCPSSGLNYNYFIDYDPAVGRYAESDPVGLVGGANTYLYAGANPVSAYDVTGLMGPGTDSFDKAFRARCKCPTAPQAPANACLNKNIKRTQSSWNPFWFYNQVRNKGPWDYKHQGGQYQDFGNFNYGAAGSGFGFPDWILLRMAG